MVVLGQVLKNACDVPGSLSYVNSGFIRESWWPDIKK